MNNFIGALVGGVLLFIGIYPIFTDYLKEDLIKSTNTHKTVEVKK